MQGGPWLLIAGIKTRAARSPTCYYHKGQTRSTACQNQPYMKQSHAGKAQGISILTQCGSNPSEALCHMGQVPNGLLGHPELVFWVKRLELWMTWEENNTGD